MPMLLYAAARFLPLFERRFVRAAFAAAYSALFYGVGYRYAYERATLPLRYAAADAAI